MSRYTLTPRARVDYQLTWNYLAEHASFEVADRWRESIRAAMKKVAANPALGHTKIESSDPRHRFFRDGNYYVVFMVNTQPLKILRILHTARDLSNLL